MDRESERIGLQEIIDKALEEMPREAGESFELDRINLAEFSRRTGLTRSRARTLKANGFKVLPHGRCGMRAATTVMSGFEGVADALLADGVTNSDVIFERISERGYRGGLTTVKNYIAAHADLVPAKRRLARAEPQGSRGRRFETGPGEAYQMDWGFVEVEDWTGATFRIACLALVCHHCGTCYVEFFPNARQENLSIGMIHAFMAMGVPEHVLTDNMKSVVIRRDLEGRPVWQADYAAFMACAGFGTRLCKPRHPFTKGKVERLIRFVKGELPGRKEVLQRHRPQRPGARMVLEAVGALPQGRRLRAGRRACGKVPPPRRRWPGPRSSRSTSARRGASASTGSSASRAGDSACRTGTRASPAASAATAIGCTSIPRTCRASWPPTRSPGAAGTASARTSTPTRSRSSCPRRRWRP